MGAVFYRLSLCRENVMNAFFCARDRRTVYSSRADFFESRYSSRTDEKLALAKLL